MKRLLRLFKAAPALDPNAKVRNRGLVVFPASSPLVIDHKDHFPINDEAQARDALSRVSAFDITPPWYRGHSVEELKAHVRSMVAHHFPDIKVDMHPESKVAKVCNTPKRRIKYAKVTHVSLVSRGANKMPVLLKSGNRVQFNMLFKQAEEGLLHSLVYVPEENGAVDTEGDVAPKTVVKQMAHDFIANGAHLDVEHDLQVLSADQASVAETFIVQKSDARFQGWIDNYGQPIDPTDAWGMIIKLSDPELQKAVKDGRIGGLSLFGLAEVEPIVKSTSNTNNLDSMTEAELKALLDARDATLLEAITKAVAPKAPAAPATPAVAAKAEVKFEGDPLNIEDVKKHQEKVFIASLDLSKSEDIEKLTKHLEAKKAAPAPAAGEQTPAQKAAAASTQSPADAQAEDEKTEAALMIKGKEFGGKVNKFLGRV